MRTLLIALICCYSVSANAIERIVSLAPSSTELIYAAGLGDKLVAVSAFSDYPPEASSLEVVASFDSVNIERIIALNPELIVAWRSGGSAKHLAQLEELGYPIFYSDTTYLAEIADRIEELSRYSTLPEVGQKNAAEFRQRLRQLQELHSDKPPVSYFYQLSSNPIFTIAQHHWPSEVFSLCGGVNIFESAPIAYPQVGIEQVVVLAPEILFTSPHTIQDTRMWQTWHQHIPAVQHGFIWSLNADWLNRPTPRSLKAVEQVCDFFDTARNKTNASNKDK